MSDLENKKPEEKISEKSAWPKSKKNKIIYLALGIGIPFIIAIFYAMNPAITNSEITVEDFPLELLGEGYDILCIPDRGCIIANFGKMEYKNKDGIHIFFSKDYSLIKLYNEKSGYEEKSVSYGFYEKDFKLTRLVYTPTDSSSLPFWMIEQIE